MMKNKSPRSERVSSRATYRFDVLTLFPEFFDSVLGTSILKRAVVKKKIDVRLWNPRDQTTDKHHVVDDSPYGGGVGMVMKVEPIVKTLKKIRKRKDAHIVLMSAKGRRFTQNIAREMVERHSQLVIICGRYEGVDQRIEKYIDEEISIGDFVLTGGELGAGVMIDAVSRLLPGVLGKDESSHDESHSQDGYFEYPQYTRPVEFDGQRVPDVLMSGNHEAIAQWRKEQSERLAKKNK